MDDAVHGKRIEAHFLGHTNLRVRSTPMSRAYICRSIKEWFAPYSPCQGAWVANARPPSSEPLRLVDGVTPLQTTALPGGIAPLAIYSLPRVAGGSERTRHLPAALTVRTPQTTQFHKG
jgi:hypothetical protein